MRYLQDLYGNSGSPETNANLHNMKLNFYTENNLQIAQYELRNRTPKSNKKKKHKINEKHNALVATLSFTQILEAMKIVHLTNTSLSIKVQWNPDFTIWQIYR